MVRDKFIPVDLDTSSLHLTTNSATGSGDKTVIWYYNDEKGLPAGGIIIYFTSVVKYRLVQCQRGPRTFPVRIPSEQDKHWVIEKHGYRTVVLCNSQQVLDITTSPETCDSYSNTFATYWGREVTSIKFPSSWDTASDVYYITG